MAGSFVATQTVTVRGEDGQLADLTAGQSYVYDDLHYLVRTYPDVWAPTTSKRNTRQRQRGAQRRWAL
jgi:hypothetical protein